MIARIIGKAPEEIKSIGIMPMQLPVYPVYPEPGAEALGVITWDQPEMIKYVPETELTAYVEMINPSAERRLYAVSYYFIDLNGTIVDEGFVTFMAGDVEFTAFYLPPQAEDPAFFEIAFSASQADYAFGLRLLLCEMTDDSARVIQETSRVQVLMASEETYNKYQGTDIIPMTIGLLALVMLGTMVVSMAKGTKKKEV